LFYFHASRDGGIRRQWRTDFVRDPVDAERERETIAYYAAIYSPDWDGGYDVDRFPSYGPDWRASGRRSVRRLEQLGVYDFAGKHESFMREKRRSSE